MAEIGTDMTRFPTAEHLASWAGMCPGQPRERRQAPQRQDAQGEPLAAGLPGRGRPRRGPHQGHLPGGAVPAPGRPPRPGEGRRRRRPHHPGHRLPPADGGHGLPRPGRQLLRRARSSGGRTSARASPGRAGLHGVPDTSGLASGGSTLFSDQTRLGIIGTTLPLFPLDSVGPRFQIRRLFPGYRNHFPEDAGLPSSRPDCWCGRRGGRRRSRNNHSNALLTPSSPPSGACSCMSATVH